MTNDKFVADTSTYLMIALISRNDTGTSSSPKLHTHEQRTYVLHIHIREIH